MTSQRPDDHGDLLRRVLRAEADQVVPSPEGLEIIRARISRRGVRNLFWWRASAGVASALLVAGTVVMVVPEWRNTVITNVVDNGGTPIGPAEPSSSSTSRSKPPEQSPQDPPAVPNPGTPTARQPQQQPKSQRAESTSQPSTSPSPTPTECPTPAPEESDCPEESPSPSPSETTSVEPDGACPGEECPPEESPADPAPTIEYSPLAEPTG
ncbi:hypothetical protein [Nonomuraea sp. NPDC050310]|uniref:hypothetical protein n=1 Tax=unclassified Nonomuraea TaxID=2593643 RepID=UPI0033F0C65C